MNRKKQYPVLLITWPLTARKRKTLDIITVFHKPSNPASTRVANLLKQVSANAQAEATIDQASDHSAQTNTPRDDFELNITEDPPTQDQVQTILGYVGKSGIGNVIKGARDEKEALEKFKQSSENFRRPMVRYFPFAQRNTSQADQLLGCGLEQRQSCLRRQRIRDSQAAQCFKAAMKRRELLYLYQ